MRLSKGLTFARDFAWPAILSLFPNRQDAPIDFLHGGGLRMTCYRALPEDPRMLQAWEDLALRCTSSTAFHMPDWQFPLLHQAMQLGRMRLLGVFRGDKALAILPLQLRSGNRFETVGSMISDYLDPLIDPSCEETAWQGIFELLHQMSEGAPFSLTLHNVRDDAACRGTLGRIGRESGCDVEDSITSTVARVALPESWDAYLGSLNAHDRKECRRKLRKAETQAEAALTVCESPEQAPSHLEHVFRCMESTGGSKGQKCRWIYRRVFGAATRGLMRRGAMRLQTLRLCGKPAAGIISFRSASGPLAWGAGYDPDQAAWSPGVVAFAMAIRDAIERGDRVFDFLRGDQRYKYDLGAVDHPLHRLTLTPRLAA